MKSWVFTTQAVTLWLVGMYACTRPERATRLLVTAVPAAVLLPLVVAWLSG